MYPSTFLLAFFGPALIAASTNTTSDDASSIPNITNLTDLDSLINTFDPCDRRCTREFSLARFNTKALYPECNTVTGQTNEKVDWPCFCQLYGDSPSVDAKTLLDSTSEVNKTLTAIDDQLEKCLDELVAIPELECNDKDTKWEAHADKFHKYCKETYASDKKPNDTTTDPKNGSDTSDGTKTGEKNGDKSTEGGSKSSSATMSARRDIVTCGALILSVVFMSTTLS
ncbi:hypothetical protein BJ508DRAFT_330666 [Ascobolus immersus RN42]|uniref:Extracellular membrane protein CFEM domain-containing protein n=1 Tax=Ascobolus immersus RN42 TaxID=1160509 RepID=A0A3N4HUC5_ASCIM|nr:hypothetical protein BJ508DRAFT_330666 [Ascobolus immersus RN42]